MQTLQIRAQATYGLTERQAQLVAAYCHSGNLASACRQVGYDYREAKRMLAEHPGFQAATREYIQGLLVRDLVRARNVLLDLMERAQSEKVRLDAAKFLTERAAGKTPERHLHLHEHRFTSREELVKRITELAGELGINVPVAAPQAIEGEVVRTEEPPPPDDYTPPIPGLDDA